jgi:putative addiction module killer protein
VHSQEREIRYYEDSLGNQPFQEWFDSIRDKNTQARIQLRIDRLEAGNPGKCESVGQGVMELKIDFGPGYRVYYGQVGSEVVIL